MRLREILSLPRDAIPRAYERPGLPYDRVQPSPQFGLAFQVVLIGVVVRLSREEIDFPHQTEVQRALILH